MRLADRVVLITGATGGLGRAAAAAFAGAGALLALSGTDHDRLAAAASDLDLADDRWIAAVGNLGEPDSARTVAQAVTSRFGRIDILLHLVGGWAGGTAVTELDHAETRTMLDQHVWTTLNIVQAVVPGMIERGWGRVIAASSSAAVNAPAKAGNYAAAKAAQETLLRSLAREVAASGVTVNVVSLRSIDEKHERETAPSPKNAPSTTPEEIAATILFLCSDEAAPINGARIPLDGRA